MADSPASMQVAFVCVKNAGRSQIAYAFAKRELAERGLENRVSLVTGGTRPAEDVHEEVIEAMAEVGIDIADRTPREITIEETHNCDYVITMGCSAEDVCPAGWAGESRDWDLEDPKGKDSNQVRKIRDEIERRVGDLFNEIERA